MASQPNAPNPLSFENLSAFVEEARAKRAEFDRRFPLPPAPGFKWDQIGGQTVLCLPHNITLAGLEMLAGSWEDR